MELKKLGKGTLIYGLGQVLAKGLNFFLLPLLTAYLSPEDYGVISILLVYGFLAAPIFSLGLGNSIGIVYFVGNSESRKSQTVWTSFLLLLASSVVFVLISYLQAEEMSSFLFDKEDHHGLILLASLSSVFSGILSQPFIFRLQFDQRSVRFVLMTLLSTSISAGAIVWFVVFRNEGVVGFMIATLIGSISSFLLYFLAVIRWTPLITNLQVAFDLVKYGYPMIPASLLVFTIQNTGRYLLHRYHGPADVGIYSVGFTFGMIMNVAVTAFTSAWFPYFNSFTDKLDEARRVFSKVLRYYVLSGGTLCLIFFIFARPLITIMTEESFYDAHKVIGFLSLGNFLIGVSSIFSSSLYFAKKLYLLNLVQVGAVLTCLAVSMALIPILGIVGAALGYLLAYLIMALLQYEVSSRVSEWKVDYQWNGMRKFIVISFLVVAVSVAPRSLPFLIELLISVVISFGLILVMYRFVEAEDKRIIQGLIRLAFDSIRLRNFRV